jgi:hypothetical protein
MKRPPPRGAPLAREIRLLVGPALGSWSKVLQLTALMVVLALVIVIAVVVASADSSWSISLLDSILW